MMIDYVNKESGKTEPLSVDKKLHEIIMLTHEREKKINGDTVIIVDGKNGTGKSNIASLICAVKAHISGREYNMSHVFFEPEKMVKYACETEGQIIHFDEALMSGMASDWQSKFQKKLIKMLWMARKKKHFIVLCIPDSTKLKDIIFDRAIGLLHTYLRNGIEAGKFVYFKEKSKEIFYSHWKKTGIKDYTKYYSIRGTFGHVLPRILDENKYEAAKDRAILSLTDDDDKGTAKEQRLEKKMAEFMEKLVNLPKKLGVTQKELAKAFDITEQTMIKYKKVNKNGGFPLENGVFDEKLNAPIHISREKGAEDIIDNTPDDWDKEE